MRGAFTHSCHASSCLAGTHVLNTRALARICLGLLLCCTTPVIAQAQQSTATAGQQTRPTAGPTDALPPSDLANPPTGTGSISGTIVDQTGNAVSGARVVLARGSAVQETISDDDGQFFFVNVPAGPFQLTIAAPSFSTQNVSGTVHGGEAYTVPRLTLSVTGVTTQVQVMPTAQLAEVQIKQQEKQRVLGVPNFYVTYAPNPAPLDTDQKFQLAWHSTIDPVTLGIVAGTAGVQQAVNQYTAFGQGAEGYGKRFAAAYADVTISSFLGGAVLPSLFKQDPRFFFKETGSKKQRVLYAIAASVMCKGDNGHWQPNYSGILGSLAAGGIANLYYPAQNRDDMAVTFEGTAIGIGATAGENILQEFVVPKFTRKKGPKPGGSSGQP